MYFKFEFPNRDGGKQILMWILETGMEKQKKVHKKMFQQTLYTAVQCRHIVTRGNSAKCV